MQLFDDEIIQAETAFQWIKYNHLKVIERFVDRKELIADNEPVTIFMAGSPGAGKTEVSKRLVSRFTKKPVRIDADEIRSICPGYIGSNAHIFQKAATKGVNILYDYVLKHNINTILDGTFAYADSLKNIERSLNHKRQVEVFFVYQDPLQAWDFTKKREAIEHRMVSAEVFIDAFIKSQEHVHEAKQHFGDRIEVNLLIKDFERDLEQLELNVQTIGQFIQMRYTRDELINLII